MGRAPDQLAVLFDVDHVWAVDHDLGDAGIVEQPLQRAVTENVVLDVADEPLPLLRGQRNLLLLDHMVQIRTDQRVQLALAQRGVVESAAQPLEQCCRGAVLELHERVIAGVRLRPTPSVPRVPLRLPTRGSFGPLGAQPQS